MVAESVTDNLTETQRARGYEAVDESLRSDVRDPRVFGIKERVAIGWYWALESNALKRESVVPIDLLGKKLALWRGKDGKVHCVDAYCPHMGAHFAEGRVEGDTLRCFFHGWGFDGDGRLADIPCQDRPLDVTVRTWPCEERYGLIWVFTGPTATIPLFEIPELAGKPVASALGVPFTKGCHPNIVMVNAIDEQHFTTVHRLPVDLCFAIDERDRQTITFANTTRMPEEKLWQRWVSRFYAGPLTYSMCYRSGSTGSVTVGPDFLHCHIIFALRPTSDGKAEGQTILVADERKGFVGWLVNKVILFATKLVGDYFAHGDTRVFQTIRWRFTQPIAADRSIVRFVKHLEKQPTVRFGSWEDDDNVVTLRSATDRTATDRSSSERASTERA